MNTKLTNNIKITLIVLIMLISASVVLFMSTKDSSYAVDLNNQNNQTNSAYVFFDAGFVNSAGNIEHSAILDVNPEWKNLRVYIGLVEGCTLINPTVQFYDSSNSSDINFDLGNGFGSTTGTYIKSTSASNKSIQFENLTTGLNYDFSIFTTIGKNVKISKLNETNKAVFTATVQDSSGNKSSVYKEIYFNVGWTANLSMNMTQTLERFSHVVNGGEDNLVIETEVIAKIDTAGKYNILPVQQTQIVVDVPSYQGIAPKTVNVTSKRTGATNGKINSDVVFNNSNWSYNQSTGKLTITVTNTSSSGTVVSSRDYDEYHITYTYPQAAYDAVNTSGVNITNKVVGTMTLYSNNSNKTITKTINDTIKLTNYIDKEVEGTFSKSYLYFNTIGMYTTDLEYSYGITYKNRQKVDGTKDKSIYEQVKFKTADGTEYNSFIGGVNYVPISRILIPESSFRSYFGSSGTGSVMIYENDTSLIGTITLSSSTENISGTNYYTFTIPTDVKNRAEKISIVHTSPATELAELEVKIEREIAKNLPYTIKQLQSFKQMSELIQSYHTKSATSSEYEHNAENDLTMTNYFKDTNTNADLSITTPTLKATGEEQDLELDIVLDNGHSDTDVWQTPTMDIVLPEYITEVSNSVNSSVNISASNTIYMGRYIYERQIDNKWHIIIPFQGEQKGLFNPQTIVHIKARVKVDPFATNSSEDILLYYINNLAYEYKNPSVWPSTPSTTGQTVNNRDILADGTVCGIAKAEINFTTTPTLLCATEISNYNGSNTIDSIKDKDTAAQIERTGNSNPKMTIIAQNNHTVPISNVVLLGRIPYTNNKYAVSNADLGTNINTELASLITTTSGKNVTIYYSDNLDATKDLSLASNNWTTSASSLSTVKSYLIVVNDTLAEKEQIRFSYDFKLPSKINYNKFLYANFGAYYTADGTDRTSETDKIGLKTETGPILRLEKISTINGGGTKVKEGSVITYAITVSNVGSVIAQDVEITDMIPENTTYVETDAAGEYVKDGTKDRVTHKISTLNVGESAVFSFSVMVNEITEDTKIKNTATAVAEGVDQVESNTDEIQAIKTTPKLEVTKTSDIAEGTTVSDGDRITYTITVRNTGDGIAHNVVIKDKIPENTNYYDTDKSKIDTEKTEIVLDPQEIKPGESYTYTFTVVVKELDENKTIQNTAIVSANNLEDVNSNTVSISATQKLPKLEITKTSDISAGTQVKEGDLITYTITVKNTGEGNAKNVVITDTIPTGTIYYDTETSTAKPEIPSVNSTTKEILKPNESFTYTFKVQVGRVSSNKVIANIAKVVCDNLAEVSSEPANVDAKTTVPNLRINKISNIAEGTSVKEGNTITYTIEVENIGAQPAYDVVIKDNIPANTTYYENNTKDATKRSVEKNIEKLNPGERATYSFTVIVDEISTNTIIENTATVNAENGTEKNSNKVLVNATPKVANLEVKKTSNIAEGTILKEGDLITYTITAKNIGDGIANNVVINDTIPAGTVYYDTVTNTTKPEVTTVNSDTKATLNPDESFTYEFTVRVGRISTDRAISNVAKVISRNLGEVASNTVNINATTTAPNIRVTKTSSVPEGETIKNRDTITYTIKVENIGTQPAYDVVISDTIPEHTIYYENNIKDVNKKSVEKTIEIIEPGKSAEYSFTVIVDDISSEVTIENTAKARAENGTEQTSNKITTNAIPRVPSLEVTKTSSIPAGEHGTSVKEGDLITYSIRVRNIGDGIAENVIIRDYVPEGTSYYDTETDTIDSEKREVTSEPKAQLNPNEQFTYEFTVKVGRVSKQKTIQNTARVVSDNLDEEISNTVSNVAMVTIPNIKVTKTSNIAEGTVVKEGDLITYSITVENIGTMPAYDVVISDTVPEHTIYYENSTKDLEKKNVGKTIPTLNPGGKETYSFTVIVDKIDSNISIQNTATAVAENGIEQESNTVAVSGVPKTPKLQLTKTSNIAEGAVVREGDLITYTITVNNIGEAPANNVIIKDNIPENTVYYNTEENRPEEETKSVMSETKDVLEINESFSYSFTVQVKEINEDTKIKNTATVIGEKLEESSSNELEITAKTPSPELKLIKTSSVKEGETVKEGDIVEYKLTVTNIGNASASGVIIADVIPENTVYYDETTNETNPLVKISFSDIKEILNPGESFEYKFKVKIGRISKEIQIANTATAKGENVAEISSNTETIKAITTTPKLRLEKTSNIKEGQTIKEGDTIEYTLTVYNYGDMPAYDVEIKDKVPQYTAYYENGTKDVEKIDVGKKIEVLEPGQSDTYSFTVIVEEIPENTTISNTATVAGENGPDVSSNTIGVKAEASKPELVLAKASSIDKTKTVMSGSIIEYTILVKNIGECTAHNVIISDAIPENTTYVTKSGKSYERDESKKEITKVIESLEPGKSEMLTFSVIVNNLNSNAQINNVAKVNANNFEEISSNIVSISAKSDEKKGGKLPNTGAYSIIIISIVGITLLSGYAVYKHKKIRR